MIILPAVGPGVHAYNVGLAMVPDFICMRTSARLCPVATAPVLFPEIITPLLMIAFALSW